jgi:CheY-like chemotaxis protein
VQLRVLVVDDNRINLLMTRRMLENAGHAAMVAENGAQALDILAQESFDIVLMDISMPVMDGVECTRLLRAGKAGEANKTVPILAITAHAMAGDRELFLAKGMDNYLAKPFEWGELHAAIATTLATFA